MQGNVEHRAATDINGVVPLNVKEWQAIEHFLDWVYARYEIIYVANIDNAYDVSKDALIIAYQQDTGK